MGWVIIATLLAGSASAVGQPVRSSLIPALVGKDQLFGAIALNAIAMTLSLILGPVLVKVVGDRFGFEGAFWFQAGLLIFGTVFLLMLEVPAHEAARERRPVVTEVREAIHHILGDSQLKTLFGLLLTGSLTVNPAVMVTLQAHVNSELGRNAGDAAIPFAMMGIGIAISSLYLMRRGDMANKGAVFQRAMMVSGATILLIGFADSFAVVVGLSILVGLSGGFFINMNQGLIQARTPQPLMGRVMAVYTLVASGLFPVGALLLGLLATVIGTGATISLAATISLCHRHHHLCAQRRAPPARIAQRARNAETAVRSCRGSIVIADVGSEPQRVHRNAPPMTAQRAIAVVAAAVMIVGAWFVRDRVLDDDDDAGTTTSTGEVVCVTDLEEICRTLEDTLDVDVRIESVDDTLQAWGSADEIPNEVWITMAPFPDMVESLRTGARLPPADAQVEVIASSPLTLVAFEDSAEEVTVACGDPVDWACLGSDSNDLTVGFAPFPDFAIGQLGVTSAVLGFGNGALPPHGDPISRCGRGNSPPPTKRAAAPPWRRFRPVPASTSPSAPRPSSPTPMRHDSPCWNPRARCRSRWSSPHPQVPVFPAVWPTPCATSSPSRAGPPLELRAQRWLRLTCWRFARSGRTINDPHVHETRRQRARPRRPDRDRGCVHRQ